MKQILANRFHNAAAMEVVELLEGNKLMVTEKRWYFEHQSECTKAPNHIGCRAHEQKQSCQSVGVQSKVKCTYLFMRRLVHVGKGRNTNSYAGMQWDIFENGRNFHSQPFYGTMCMIIASTRVCNTFTKTISSQ